MPNGTISLCQRSAKRHLSDSKPKGTFHQCQMAAFDYAELQNKIHLSFRPNYKPQRHISLMPNGIIQSCQVPIKRPPKLLFSPLPLLFQKRSVRQSTTMCPCITSPQAPASRPRTLLCRISALLRHVRALQHQVHALLRRARALLVHVLALLHLICALLLSEDLR